MDGDVYHWKPEDRQGMISSALDMLNMTLGHPSESVQEVAGNKNQGLAGDTEDEHRDVSEQHRCTNRGRFYRLGMGPRMASWVTSTFMRHFIVCPGV